MPDHTYTTNEEPTTANVNAWVRDQVITIETAVNIAAIASPTTGRHAWDSTNKVLLRYDGSAWVPANVPVFTAAGLPASPKTDAVVFESDAETLIRYDGSAWSPVGTVVCTSATRPATPRDGQTISETDTDRVYVYQSSAWCPMPGAHVAAAASTPNTATGVIHYHSDRRRLTVYNGGWETVGPFICTSGTRPTNPAEGDWLWETDTNMPVVYDGTNWVYFPAAYVASTAPTNKLAGTLFIDSDDNSLQAWNGSSWVTYSPVALLTGGGQNDGTGTTYSSGNVSTNGSSEAESKLPIPYACTISKLYINYDTAPGSGKSRAHTVRKNGSDTAVTCTVSNLSTTGSDTGNSVTFAAGDLFTVSAVPTSTPASTYWNWSVKIVPT